MDSACRPGESDGEQSAWSATGRIVACLKGLATGDAIGKQTETLSRADVQRWYPEGISGFHGRRGDVIPRYAGTRYEWRVGETTDDTEQTLAVARAVLQEGEAKHEAIGRELLRCKKSVHPGVSMWAFVQSGDPARMAPDGDGCGAAMRVAPIGAIVPPDDPDRLIHGAFECAMPTHGGQLAISAAAAVAAAVSAAIEGWPAPEVFTVALKASRKAEHLRRTDNKVTISRSLEKIYSDLAGSTMPAVNDIAEQYFPDRPQTIVPLAISLALITESAEKTVLCAANVGGDADSVASIGGAIAGALRPETVNEDWFAVVSAVNEDKVLDVAQALSSIRRRAIDSVRET